MDCNANEETNSQSEKKRLLPTNTLRLKFRAMSNI